MDEDSSSSCLRGRKRQRLSPPSSQQKGASKHGSSTSQKSKVQTMNGDVIQLKSAENCAEQWESLFKLRDRHFVAPTTASSQDDDPFDCSECIVPTTDELIKNEVERGLGRWTDLASRVIVNEDEDWEDGPDKHRILGASATGDQRKHRLLPYGFDITGQISDDPEQSLDPDRTEHGQAFQNRPQVISLLDPTQTVDYEKELHQLFKSTKTADELERSYALGNTKEPTADDLQISHGLHHTLEVRTSMKDWIKKYSRIDAHSLGRMRPRERHGAVPTSTAARVGNGRSRVSTSVRFEAMRHSQNYGRGSGLERGRLEVELDGRHTLLDLHRVLTGSTGSEVPSGIFFIEDRFYVHGGLGQSIVDEVSSWLDEDEAEGSSTLMESKTKAAKESSEKSRRWRLGISRTSNESIDMSEAPLRKIPLRLGVRYVHIAVPCKLNQLSGMDSMSIETALFATDIQTYLSSQGGKMPGPILHDIWTQPERPTCMACKSTTASVVVVDDPLIPDVAPPPIRHNCDAEEDGDTLEFHGACLCQFCYRALHYEPCDERDECGMTLLKLKPEDQPRLVFSVAEYLRMMDESTEDAEMRKKVF